MRVVTAESFAAVDEPGGEALLGTNDSAVICEGGDVMFYGDGGAGKTTVMGALLNFVPAEVQLVPADGSSAIERGSREREPRRCFVCHEIGSGSYYAYLWGADLHKVCSAYTCGVPVQGVHQGSAVGLFQRKVV